jgi:hypothetical protein
MRQMISGTYQRRLTCSGLPERPAQMRGPAWRTASDTPSS